MGLTVCVLILQVLIDTARDRAAWLRLTNKRAASHEIGKSHYIVNIASWHYTPKVRAEYGLRPSICS